MSTSIKAEAEAEISVLQPVILHGLHLLLRKLQGFELHEHRQVYEVVLLQFALFFQCHDCHSSLVLVGDGLCMQIHHTWWTRPSSPGLTRRGFRVLGLGFRV